MYWLTTICQSNDFVAFYVKSSILSTFDPLKKRAFFQEYIEPLNSSCTVWSTKLEKYSMNHQNCNNTAWTAKNWTKSHIHWLIHFAALPFWRFILYFADTTVFLWVTLVVVWYGMSKKLPNDHDKAIAMSTIIHTAPLCSLDVCKKCALIKLQQKFLLWSSESCHKNMDSVTIPRVIGPDIAK